MIWDLEDIVFTAVISTGVLLFLWMIVRRSRLKWSRGKVEGFCLAVYCFGVALIVLFELMTTVAGRPAEIQGQVSQVNLRYPPGRNGDHSQFEVTSPNGLTVKLLSERHIAERLKIGDVLYVRYDPLTSEPEKVERLDGATRQVLFDYRDVPIFRIFTPINCALLVAAAMGGIYGVRKFRAG
jgi:hypothetical protein